MPSDIGFPPQPRQAALTKLVTTLRDRSTTLQQETVTGRSADIAAARNGRVAEVLEIEKSLADLATRRSSIDLADARATATQDSLAQLRKLTDDLVVQLTVTLSSGSARAFATAGRLAEDTLGAAIGALDASFGGRGLFSGDGGGGALAPTADFLAEARSIVSTGGSPGAITAALDTAFLDPGGAFATTLYTGGTGNAPLVEVAPGEQLDLSARADETPIRGLLRDFAAIAAALDPASGLQSDQARAIAEDAVAKLRSSSDPMSLISARIGSGEQRMETIRSQLSATEATLSITHTKLTGRDPFEAATELTSVQTQLETLLASTARLSSLSLANYL